MLYLIFIKHIKEPIAGERYATLKDLTGITFYIPHKKKIRVFITGKELKNVKLNLPDFTGRASITLR